MVTGDGEGMAGGEGMVTDGQRDPSGYDGIRLKAQTQRKGGAKVEGRLTSTGGRPGEVEPMDPRAQTESLRHRWHRRPRKCRGDGRLK